MTSIVRTRLDNGLVVLSEEIHTAPVVALQAWVQVGSADEEPHEAGLAHLHEHMLFKGTQRRGVGGIAREVEAAGGEINAWTSFDQTVYHIVLAQSELATAADILADALQHSTFDAQELAREKEVVLEEIRRAQDAPARRLGQVLFDTAYGAHPYGRPVLGTVATVSKFDRDAMVAFFRRHYRPDNVTLVAVGDFHTPQLLEILHEAFGGWAALAPYARKARVKEEPQRQVRVQVLREPVKEARLAVAWHIPQVRHADIAALDLLAVLLGYGDSSRLFMETRRRRQWVNDVNAHAYTPRDPGLMMLGAGLKAENLCPALRSILGEAYRLPHQWLSEDELAKAKVVLLSDAAYSRETVQGQARKLGFYEVVAGDYNFENDYTAQLKTLRPENVRAVAARYLTPYATVVAQVPEDHPGDLTATMLTEVLQEAYAAAHEPARLARTRGPMEVTRVDLDNGATLLVRPEEGPVTAMRAVSLAGLRWETRETCGISALFASVWGLATHDASPEVLAHRVAALGGTLAAFGGRNTVGLRGDFIRDQGLAGLQLFCDALARPAFTQAEVERERAVALERIRNREDNPAAVAFDLLAAALFPTHPYGLRISGQEEAVQGFGLEHMWSYFNTFLSPDKLVVAICGGVDVDRALDLLSESLDQARGPLLPAVPVLSALAASERRRARHAADKKQCHVMVGGVGTTVLSAERFALEVLITILSGQSGRLFTDLRDQQSLAYSVSMANIDGIDPGMIWAHIGTAPEKVDQALAGIHGHFAALQRKPVLAAELERAQRYLIGSHAIDLQRAGARAMNMALNERLGRGYDAHMQYAENIKQVTIKEIRQVAEQYLASERLVEVVVGPTAKGENNGS